MSGWAWVVAASASAWIIIAISTILERRARRRLMTDVRTASAEMRDYSLQVADAARTVIPLFEDMISRDPTIAESLEVNRLVLIDGVAKLTRQAERLDAVVRDDMDTLRRMMREDEAGWRSSGRRLP